MINLCMHNEDFNFTIEWLLFSTSHGKIPCFGIGGTVKIVSRINVSILGKY